MTGGVEGWGRGERKDRGKAALSRYKVEVPLSGVEKRMKPTTKRKPMQGSHVIVYAIGGALFRPSSWTTGLCEDLIKQIRGRVRYSTRSMRGGQRTGIESMPRPDRYCVVDFSVCGEGRRTMRKGLLSPAGCQWHRTSLDDLHPRTCATSRVGERWVSDICDWRGRGARGGKSTHVTVTSSPSPHPRPTLDLHPAHN
ncbi:hypothetical protein J6590_010891 [Homalodisca vitripennis]|nr:hypothetical protein J6590_010891 [Homalodisca vitripennis]